MSDNEDTGTSVPPEATEVAEQVPTPESAPTDTGVLEEQPGQEGSNATDEGMLPTSLLTGGAYVSS